MKDKGITKRDFLQTMGAGVPTVLALNPGLAAAQTVTGHPPAVTRKAEPIDCSNYFTASAADLGPREQAARLTRESQQDRLIRMPGGERGLRGLPFRLGPEDVNRKSWIVLRQNGEKWAAAQVEIPVDQAASFVCMAAFADWTTTASTAADPAWARGHHLADLTLAYEDGSEQRYPVRWGFEVNPPLVGFGEECYKAVPHRELVSSSLGDPLSNASLWGLLQTGVYPLDRSDPYHGSLWIAAFPSPHPNRKIRKIRFDARGEDLLFVCGLTVYKGAEHPLRLDRSRTYRFTLPEGQQGRRIDWDLDVDLGVVVKVYRLPTFDGESWLASPLAGLGESSEYLAGDRYLYAEVAAAPDAVVTLRNKQGGPAFLFDLSDVASGRETAPRPSQPRIEWIEPHNAWIRGRVLDASTERPTPVCLAFRASNGRYIPPYGHRAEINDGWFQDYGADVKRDGTSYAYVDGTFQVELPVGEVFVEVLKGFEYQPIRRKLRIEPNQRELSLEISRFSNLRAEKWASADTHVHFLSPSTAVLEGQAEDLNLIHLLAAQWGDLFTNVGDLTHRSLRSPDGEMIVHVGTENRQHLLGHLSLLGAQGDPVFPMSADGPGEGQIGMPLWSSLAEWAERSRRNDGLAVAVHFPLPIGELAADIALGKIDAVELMPRLVTEEFETLPFRDWYRYLNCGYRLPAVGGTDKMRASNAVGFNRTYTYLGDDEFSVQNWSKAVRRGNTFMSSGPLLLFKADGRAPGEEISFRAGGGRVAVEAHARCMAPIHRLEIVRNGEVVASQVEERGARELRLSETIEVSGPGWLAARCFSRFQSSGSRIAAHTSPVYITVPGRELFSAPVASYMLRLIDGADSWVRELATRPDPETLERMFRVLRDAKAAVEERLRRLATP
ncbi:MAG TPA: CehA/McbA family metallohydrolase [Bryobacteraceae bacterium]|nr:CehA/McbA family metallohydrolase [Bryobacteraceae bacterium]